MRVLAAFVGTAALLSGLAACTGPGPGPDREPAQRPTAVGSETPGATPSPTPGWLPNPGQRDKVVDRLTAKKYACSTLDGTTFTFTVCAKTLSGHPTKWTQWIKLVTPADGTVVHVRTSGVKENLAGLAAVIGDKDANILLAGGKKLSWGTPYGSAVTINGFAEPLNPPQPQAFQTSKEDLLAIYQTDRKMDCRLTDPTATPSPEPTPSSNYDATPMASPTTPLPTPEPTSYLSCGRLSGYGEPDVTITATATGDRITGLELFASASADGPFDAHKGPTYLPVSKVFANAKTALLGQTKKLWPALEGADVANLKAWTDARLKVNQNSLGYVDEHRVEVVSYQNGTYGVYQIRITISNEQPDLTEPPR